MTQDRVLKRAIRQRMDENGEKYTEARRHVLGGAPAPEAPILPKAPFYSEPFWEEKRWQYEQVAEGEGEAVARATIYRALDVLQLMFALGGAPATGLGGQPSAPGGWLLPKREYVEGNAAAIAASTPLVSAGFGRQIERNRQIVERVLALIDERPKAPEQAREQPRPQRTLKVSRSLPAGGPDGWGRSRELGHEPLRSSRDHALRHPYEIDRLRAFAEGIGDSTLAELVDAWIDDLEHNYRTLVDGIPTAWRQHGPLDFEALIEDLADEDNPDPGFDWSTALPSPARVRVQKRFSGDVGDHEPIATSVLVVEGSFASQSDGIVAVPHEWWRIRGERLIDGTIMPCAGTYRMVSAGPTRA